MATTEHPTFSSFAEFYPFYLGEHQDRTCRRLHFAGCGGCSVRRSAAMRLRGSGTSALKRTGPPPFVTRSTA